MADAPTRAGLAADGLVAVHAHPDDETLATGALLAAFARAGRPTAVVTCTRGERGEVIGPALKHLEGDGPALAAHRETELAAALAALGVREHTFLDRVPLPSDEAPVRYEDSGMAWVGGATAGVGDDVPARAFITVPLDEAAQRLARVLRRLAPAVVATYEPGGGYGHPDHVAAHEVTRRAVLLASTRGDDEHAAIPAPVVLWAAQGLAAAQAASAALRGPGVAALLGPALAGPGGAGGEGSVFPPPEDLEPPTVVVPDDELDLGVVVAPVREAVLAALRAHATQVQAVAAVDDEPALVGCYALSLGRLEPLLPREGYRVAAWPGLGDPGLVEWPAGVRE